MALGPSIGGFVTESVGWRWVFWINIFIVTAIVWGVLTTIEPDKPQGRTAARIDIAGVASLTLFLALTIWFLLHGAEIAGVNLPAWASGALLLAALGLFVITQTTQKEPAFRLDVFRSRDFVGMCFVPLGISVGYWSLLIYLPLLLANGFDLSTTVSSWLMLALTLPMVFLPFLGSKLAAKTNERTFFGSGMAALTLACALMGVGASLANITIVLLGMAVAGASTALVNAQISGAIVAFVPAERSGAASAIATTLRQGGFALGIAMLGAVLAWSKQSDQIANDPVLFAPLFFVAALCVALATMLLVTLVRCPKAAETV